MLYSIGYRTKDKVDLELTSVDPAILIEARTVIQSSLEEPLLLPMINRVLIIAHLINQIKIKEAIEKEFKYVKNIKTFLSLEEVKAKLTKKRMRVWHVVLDLASKDLLENDLTF